MCTIFHGKFECVWFFKMRSGDIDGYYHRDGTFSRLSQAGIRFESSVLIPRESKIANRDDSNMRSFLFWCDVPRFLILTCLKYKCLRLLQYQNPKMTYSSKAKFFFESPLPQPNNSKYFQQQKFERKKVKYIPASTMHSQRKTATTKKQKGEKETKSLKHLMKTKL